MVKQFSSTYRLSFTRFIAAILIFIYHGICTGKAIFPFSSPIVATFFQNGNQAVFYFFFISGFILYINYASKNISFKTFYFDRFARIYPTYFLGILVVTITPLIIQFLRLIILPDQVSITQMIQIGIQNISNWFDTNGIALFLNLTFLQTWFSGYLYSISATNWSLSVEIFLYLLFPIIILVLKKKSSVIQLIVLPILFYLLTVLANYFLILEHAYINSNPPFYPVWFLSIFILGIQMGIFYTDKKTFYNYYILIWRILASIALILILTSNEPKLMMKIGLFSPIFIVFVDYILRAENVFTQKLTHPYLIRLGEISYAMYIFNLPISNILGPILPQVFKNLSPELEFFITAFATIILSHFVFTYFEIPAKQKLRKTFSRAN